MKVASIVAVLAILGVQSSSEKVVPAAALSVPVTVVNGVTEPVPTTVRGTVQVGGTVGISGTPNVHVVSMPTVAVAGPVPVNVLSMPSVTVGGTVPVQVQSMPAVALAGTPTVNVGNFPPSIGGGSTALVFAHTLTIDASDFALVGPVDVSAYREVRVTANAFGLVDYKVQVLLVDDSGLGRDLLLDTNIVDASLGSGTRLYNVPGRFIKFVVFGPSSGSSNVGISVYGR